MNIGDANARKKWSANPLCPMVKQLRNITKKHMGSVSDQPISTCDVPYNR